MYSVLQQFIFTNNKRSLEHHCPSLISTFQIYKFVENPILRRLCLVRV